MDKIIITGTDGFIGKNMLKACQDDFNVYEINEDIFNLPNWGDTLVNTIKDIEPDGIFHIGACSNTLETDANYMMTRNFEFTRIIADLCYLNDIRLIYSSSAANYGTNEKYPSNLYGWSKYTAEKYVNMSGAIALRYFNVYGPLEEHKGIMASVAYQMLEKQKSGQEIKLFPKKPQRDFVYVNDVVSANLYAYKNYYDLLPMFYEVGSGEARTFEDVLDNLDISYSYYNENEIPDGYQFYTKSDSSKWMEGWTPEFNLERGLNDYKKYLNL